MIIGVRVPSRSGAARKERGAGGISAALRGLLAALWAIWFANGVAVHADEVVSFASLDGALTGGTPIALRGLLLRPSGAGPFPAVVALHGCTGLFDKQGDLIAREAAWGQLLTARGYVVLFPDSFGPRGVASDCEGSVRPWAERSYDAYGAL
jgi:poly(3-hydroxybutyrate) depolymerase